MGFGLAAGVSFGASQATLGALGVQAAIPIAGCIAALIFIAGLGAIFYRKLMWPKQNVWRSSPVGQAITRSLPDGEVKLELLKSYRESSPSYHVREGDFDQTDTQQIGHELWRIPALEHRALDVARRGDMSTASNLLGQALRLGQEGFGEGDVRYGEQLYRYSAVRVQATATKERALEERAASSPPSRATRGSCPLRPTKGRGITLPGPRLVACSWG
jgi:hypothetical protein